LAVASARRVFGRRQLLIGVSVTSKAKYRINKRGEDMSLLKGTIKDTKELKNTHWCTESFCVYGFEWISK